MTTNASKRVHLLQEFVAHESKVNCVKIGRKSGRVMVTGGDDAKVAMWAIGKAQPIMTLSGMTSPVECVAFDAEEQLVVAGSVSGTIRIWDLDEQQVVRTFNGHKSNCTSVDFHPFGEFFASGSTDTELKIWDIRKKGCIQTYKGHNRTINNIKFSPDGMWVISGSEDGVIKLWDLTAGKPLHDFVGHTQSVCSLEFHPQEFLLATGSSDRTIKFWDLETFEMVCSSDVDSTKVKAVTFTPDGSALLGAYGSTLKVWGWEPMRCYDFVNIPWKDVADMNITAEQVFAISTQQSLLSVHVINLNKLRPFSKESVIMDSSVNVKSSLDLNKTSEALKQLQDAHRPLTSPPMSKESTGQIDMFPVREEKYSSTSSNVSRGLDSYAKQASPSILSSDQILTELYKPHLTMCGMLKSRSANFRLVSGLWSRGDAKEAIEAMARLNDPAAVVDILNIISERGSVFTLDMCVILLPVLTDLLAAQYDEYIVTALKVSLLLANNFGPIIKSTLQAPQSSGVDLSREERMEKCIFCSQAFSKIKSQLDRLSKLPGRVGLSAKDLLNNLRGWVPD